MAFSPDGRQIASASFDGMLRLWDAASGQPVRVMEGHKGGVHSVAFSPDGRQIASAGHDGTTRLWRAEGREVLRLRGGESSLGLLAALRSKVQRQPPASMWNWVTLDFRTDARGRWTGQGDLVNTVRYLDTTEQAEPWPWIPRYWRASDVPELQADTAPPADDGRSKPRQRASRKSKA